MNRWIMGFALTAFAACSHTAETRGGSASGKSNGEAKAVGENSEGAGAHESKSSKPATGEAQGKKPLKPATEEITTSKTTKQMFQPEGLKKMQTALNDRLQKTQEALKKNEADAVAKQKKGGPDKDKDQKAEKDSQKTQLKPPDEVKATGQLDAPTQEALRAYQSSIHLPETGLPDYETLEKLGIKPSEVMYREPPSERVGVQ